MLAIVQRSTLKRWKDLKEIKKDVQAAEDRYISIVREVDVRRSI